MIKIIKSPNICSLTKNSMIFEVESSQFFITEKVYPKLTINFTDDLFASCFIQFNFKNPETLDIETIRFRTVNSYESEGDIPVAGWIDVDWYKEFVFIQYLNKNKLLTAFFDIKFTEDNKIEIIAKEPIEALIITDVSENISDLTATFVYEIFSQFNEPIERDNYRMKALIFYNDPKNDFSYENQFELINTQNIALDKNSRGLIDVSEIINGKIEADFNEIPIPPYTISDNPLWWYYTPNLRQYFVQFKEFWNNETLGFEVESSILNAHWGGISTDDEIINDSINHILTTHKFLTWIPSGKEINKGQVDFLHFMNDNQEKPWKLLISIYTNTGVNYYELGVINLKAFQTFGFFANVEKYINNTDTTDLITLDEGEEIFKYEFLIFEFNLLTEEFNSQPSDTFKYYYRNYCNKKYILYFNSFLLPETFSTNSNWKETMNVSKEIASRGLLYNNSSLRSKNFIFSSLNQNSIVLESSLLKREEAKRLQSMINSTYTFILDDIRWIPVLIETKKSDIWMNSEFTQVLELELLKANSNDRVSFYPSLPNIIVTQVDYNFRFNLNLNGFNFKECTTLKVYKSTGELHSTMGLETDGFYFTSYATAEDWDLEGFPEGRFSYVLTVTDINDISEVLKGVFEVKYNRFKFLTGGSGTKSIYLGTINTEFTEILVKYNFSNDVSTFTTIDIKPTIHLQPIYTLDGDHEITFLAPTFKDVNTFQSHGSSLKRFNLDMLPDITELDIRNTLIDGTFYLNKLSKLRIVYIDDSPITKIELGFPKDLIFFKVKDLNLSESALENLIREFWNFRKMYLNAITLFLTDMVTANIETMALIDGTGIYAGDGLVDNNFTVTIS